jgi:hypothetical protein
VLQTLGPWPDHEAIDKARMADHNFELSPQLEEIVRRIAMGSSCGLSR